MKLSVRRSSCQTASSPATQWCLLRLSWVTVSTTCVNTTACSQHSVTTLTLTLRPVRAQESPSAGGTAHSVVSYLIYAQENPRLQIHILIFDPPPHSITLPIKQPLLRMHSAVPSHVLRPLSPRLPPPINHLRGGLSV